MHSSVSWDLSFAQGAVCGAPAAYRRFSRLRSHAARSWAGVPPVRAADVPEADASDRRRHAVIILDVPSSKTSGRALVMSRASALLVRSGICLVPTALLFA